VGSDSSISAGETSCVYLYLDVAGNFDFSPKGSKYFIMTCVLTRRPFSHINDLHNIKYDCLENGATSKHCENAQMFHASEDTQNIRDRVFAVIKQHLDNLTIYSVVIRKNKTNPMLHDPSKLYARVFEWLIDHIFRIERVSKGIKVVIVTDQLPVQKRKNALKAPLKKYLKEKTENFDTQYYLYHHRSESDVNLQVADYCCWAIQRKWERDDLRSYNYIKEKIYGEGDLFKRGDMTYYHFSEEATQK